MISRDKTKKQFIDEVVELRQRIVELEELKRQPNQAIESLRQELERYRTILENIQEGYYEVDLAGNFTFFNDSLCRFLGYSKDELMGMHYRQFTDPKSTKTLFQAFNRVYKTGKPSKGIDLKIIKKDGKRRTVHTFFSLKKDSLGHPIGFRGTVRDITKHKRVEATLRRSEERARRLSKENGTIAKIGRIINSSLNIEETYEHFAEEVKKLIPFDRIAINTISHEHKTITVAYVAGIDIKGRSQGTTVPLDGTLAGEVVRARKSVIIQAEYPSKLTDKFPGLLMAFQAGIRSLIALPLISKDEVIGTLHFHSMQPNVYRQKDLILAEEVSNQIAGAIANTKLFAERKLAEEALRQSEERYRSILESIEEGYYEVNLAGNFTFFNDSLCRFLGYSKEELMGMNYRQYTDPENAKKLFQSFNEVYRTQKPGILFDREIIKKDGTKKYVEGSIVLQKDSSGCPIGFRGIVRDITERKQFERILKQERETFFSILQKVPYGALLINVDETFLYINPEFTAITGYTIGDVPNGREWFRKAFPNPEYRHMIIAMWKKDFSLRKMANRVLSVVCKGGEVKEIEFNLTFLDDGRVIVVLSDVTERRRKEEELAYRATHDLLTGLPNRMLFKDRFDVAIAQAQRMHKKVGIIFLDLDRFKEVNDSFGHDAGDKVLCAVGNRLKEFLRNTDTVARMGGDEFILLLPNIEQGEDVINLSQAVLNIIREPFIVESHEVSISASIGIALYPDDGTDVDVLISRADKAMYDFKQRGLNTNQSNPLTIPT